MHVHTGLTAKFCFITQPSIIVFHAQILAEQICRGVLGCFIGFNQAYLHHGRLHKTFITRMQKNAKIACRQAPVTRRVFMCTIHQLPRTVCNPYNVERDASGLNAAIARPPVGMAGPDRSRYSRLISAVKASPEIPIKLLPPRCSNRSRGALLNAPLASVVKPTRSAKR